MRADERREAVLAVALPEFARGGLTGTSTEVIAQRAGISQPYLFRLFPTKKALFLAAVDLAFERILRAFRQAAGDLRGEEAVEAIGCSYQTLLADRDLLLTQLHAYAACDDADVRLTTRRGYRRLWEYVAETTNMSEEEMVEFFAHGMLMNVIAAMDLSSLDEPWARACMKQSAV
jgi:AcrR family transcriptional regulator